MMASVDLLVRADYLYPMSPGSPILRDGEVAILADRIVYAGPRQPVGAWQAGRVIDGAGKAVLPGFVNCHTHAASLIFRSQTDDFSGGLGLYNIAFRMEKEIAPEEWRVLGMLGCLDMLHAGVTTINDIWYSPDQLAEAVEQIGLRAVIANKIFDVHLEELYHGDYARYPTVGAARLRDGVDFVESWNGKVNGRILARIGTHASDTCDPALHREARAEARRLGVGMHIHTAQSQREVDHIKSAHGCGPLEYLRDIGMLAEDVVCAHLNFASDGDLDAMLECGAGYAHCPSIYPRRGRFPRTQAIRDRKIPTGYGTDWMSNDPFEAMRTAMNATRLVERNADVLPSQDALWHYTMGSARVLGLEHEIGSLEAGKKADLIMIDLERPHIQPFYGGYPALVFYAKTGDLAMSIIDGRIVLEDGHAVAFTEAGVLGQIRKDLPRWQERMRGLGSTTLGPPCDPCGGC